MKSMQTMAAAIIIPISMVFYRWNSFAAFIVTSFHFEYFFGVFAKPLFDHFRLQRQRADFLDDF